MTAQDWQERALAAESALRIEAARAEVLRTAITGPIREALRAIGSEVNTDHPERVDHGFVLANVDSAIAAARAALSAAPAPGLVLTADDAETVAGLIRALRDEIGTPERWNDCYAALALLARMSETP